MYPPRSRGRTCNSKSQGEGEKPSMRIGAKFRSIKNGIRNEGEGEFWHNGNSGKRYGGEGVAPPAAVVAPPD